jgi:hypothetical protein
MQKPQNGLPQPGSKLEKVYHLMLAGKAQRDIAKELGMKLNYLGANIRTLHMRGLIPMSDKCYATDIKPPKSPLEKIRERESTGLAFQQVRKVEPPPARDGDGMEIDVPITRRAKRRGGSTLINLAQMLDHEIHQHVREGGKLGPIERSALILVQEVLRGTD